MSTLIPATLRDIAGLELAPADVYDPLNKELFTDCKKYKCLPTIALLTLNHRDTYYLIHHEQVMLYQHSTDPPYGFTIVKQWLDEHHSQLMAIYRR